jgi:hypothetical protein
MMAERNLLLRFVFSAILAALSFAVARLPLLKKIGRWENRRFDRIYFTAYAASHFLVFLVVFVVLHEAPRTDLPAYYVPEAHSVMRGLLPYRDFQSSYAPLNPYLDAALLKVHDSSFSILIFQILCDAFSVPFWIGFLRRALNENTVRKAALLYLIQPVVIWGICIDGKNQGLIALLLAVSFYTIARREILSGVSLSLSWILVKILPVIFLPTLFFGARRRARWLIGVMAPSILVYGGFLLLRVDVSQAMRRESMFSTPQNLPYLFGALTGFEIPRLALSVVLLLVVAATLGVTVRSQLRQDTNAAGLWVMALSCELVLLTVMLVNKKSDTSYLGMCFFLLCGFVASDADRGGQWMSNWYVLLTLFGLPVVSFWFWPLKMEQAVRLHALWLAGNRNAWIMMAMQVILELSYIGLVWGLLRTVRDAAGGRESRKEASTLTAG